MIRLAIIDHWQTCDRIGAHWRTCREALLAADLVGLVKKKDMQRSRALADDANWAKHTPPPGARPQCLRVARARSQFLRR